MHACAHEFVHMGETERVSHSDRDTQREPLSQVPLEARRGYQIPVVGATDGSELPDMGAGN